MSRARAAAHAFRRETGATAVEYCGMLLIVALLLAALFRLRLPGAGARWGGQVITVIDGAQAENQATVGTGPGAGGTGNGAGGTGQGAGGTGNGAGGTGTGAGGTGQSAGGTGSGASGTGQGAGGTGAGGNGQG